MRFGAVFSLVAALIGCGSVTGQQPAEQHVLFIGDSFTSQLGDLTQWYGSDAATWGKAAHPGFGCAAIRARVPAIVDSATTTQTAVVLVGINDVVLERTASTISACILGIASDLRARGVRPVIVTMLPVSKGLNIPSLPHLTATGMNAVIRDVNAALRADASLTVVDAHATFVGADGSGLDALYNEDGLHPNDAGRRALAARTSAALRQIGVLP